MLVESIAPISTQFSRLAEAAPQALAITCEGRSLTRAELDRSTNRLARAYAEMGVGMGDYVTIALPNSIEWLEATLATWKLGAIPQPLSPRLPDAEFEGLLALRTRALLVGRDDPRGTTSALPPGFTPSCHLSDAPLPEAVSPVLRSLASGGSTGRPKLIEAGGDSRVSASTGAFFGAQDGDVNLISVPLSHNTGFNTMTIGVLMGHHVVVMPRFDAHEFLRLVAAERVTLLATVPTIMQRLLPVYRAVPNRYDMSSIRRFWHMGSPCPPAIKQAWITILGPRVVWELYAGTEQQAMTMISGEQWLTHRGSVGTVVNGQMIVLDEDGNECPAGKVGEIYMRPDPGSAPTYRYIGSTASSRNGWDSLGDLGYFDAERFLYLNDRRVDMFTVGGRNVYPAEIEAALAAHPDVLSSLVVGVPDDDLGQVPYAIVQLRAGADSNDSLLKSFLGEHLSAHKVPRTVQFTDRPLRDDAGKARRLAVRDWVIAWQHQTKDV
jgi:bile acid-coenzyme A ligase